MKMKDETGAKNSGVRSQKKEVELNLEPLNVGR